MLKREEVERALPANLKSAATQQLTDNINNMVADPLVAEQIRENFISFTTILKDGRFKTEDYLNAVAYVSFKLMGYTNVDSYARTFPQRYANLMANGQTSKDISAYVSAYNKGKLVNLIMEQTLVPVHVLNRDLYQKALNVQADLMVNANSEKVRSDAANSILTHLADPKKAAPAVNININEDSGMNELKNMLGQLANKQRELMEGGYTAKQLAEQKLTPVRTIEHDAS